MTLLFIENRYKTYFYDAVALQLKKQGHEIHFLIQNKNFKPKNTFTNHVMAYPKEVSQQVEKNEAVEQVIKSDRQQNHFGKKDQSYFYNYDKKIRAVLEKLKPDFVFGESTAFHELLTINNCRELNILYLNPSTCRYPLGRFSFYKYDTLEPYKGSEEKLSDEDAKNTVNAIVNRTAKPDYMKPIKVTKFQKINDKLRLVKGYVTGERFNTPNPIVKYKTEKTKDTHILNWDKIASDKITDGDFKVLYPLQMQPEANIDVWGRICRNQTQLIKDIAQNLPKGAILYVKPNPKSKYELNADLISFITNTKNVVALHHSTKMDDVLPKIDLVVTVTGTIAIECILSNKPVLSLVKTLNNRAANCKFVSSVEKELKSAIETVINGRFPSLDSKGHIAFINELNQTSYKGLIADPFNTANCVSEANVSDVLKAFNHVISN